eukprot:TRINITY_DN6629_c0_g2_i1.p1 TRINITY_DN6629_c0_g2~~TRINITY_DN6629_c0_g2_i1.p1  ORF type:complete len:271 (+),score=85.07 TRINITY_DN6629_c0_g2_i1:338-1150(+)
MIQLCRKKGRRKNPKLGEIHFSFLCCLDKAVLMKLYLEKYRNANLLSFDMEESVSEVTPTVVIKSSHDLLHGDKKLSSKSVLDVPKNQDEEATKKILKAKPLALEDKQSGVERRIQEDEESETSQSALASKKRKADQIDTTDSDSKNKLAEEYARLKRQLIEAQEQQDLEEANDGGSSVGRQLLAQRKEKYLQKLKSALPGKDKRARESNTLNKLAKFEETLKLKNSSKNKSQTTRKAAEEDTQEAENEDDWMGHKLEFVKRPQDFGIHE